MMYNEYDGEVLNHVKEVELMILKDFVEICDNNDIEYYLIFGTQIGAIRHQGFIPWDDDIDIMMFREDYEKFLKVMEENPNEKYTIFDPRYDNEYCFQFGRMSLNGTYWAEYWDKHVSFKLGIHIDLFVLDNLPDNKYKRWLFIQRCYVLARLYPISVLKFDNYSKAVNLLLNVAHKLLNTLGFTPKYFQKRLYNVFTKYNSNSGEYVTDLTLIERPAFKRTDYKPPKKALFEGYKFNIPNNDYNTLTPIYGDTYMQLPPEEERFNHVLNEIDFGKY